MRRFGQRGITARVQLDQCFRAGGESGDLGEERLVRVPAIGELTEMLGQVIERCDAGLISKFRHRGSLASFNLLKKRFAGCRRASLANPPADQTMRQWT